MIMYMKKYTVRKKRTTRRRRRQNKRNGGLVMPWSRSRSNVKPQASDTKLDEFKQKFDTIVETIKTMEDKELASRGFAVIYGLNDNMDISIKMRILSYLENGKIKVAETLLNKYQLISCERNPDIMRNPAAISDCIQTAFNRIETNL